MLTVYKNGQEHTGYDNVPVRYSEHSHSKHSPNEFAILGLRQRTGAL